MDNSTAALPFMLKRLKLATINQNWQLVTKKAINESWSYEQYLTELCGMEITSREDKRLQRYLKEARLPTGKNLASFNFKSVNGITQPQVYDLIHQRDWLKKGANILLFGASGLGKTHIASSIGYSLVEQGHRVRFTTATALVQQLQLAKSNLNYKMIYRN